MPVHGLRQNWLRMAASKQTSNILDELKEDLQCAICNDLVHEPKFLQCLHTFCSDCLYELATLASEPSYGCNTPVGSFSVGASSGASIAAQRRARGWSGSQDQRILVCPLCREETPLPPDGIAGLKSNLLASSLLEKMSITDDVDKKKDDSLYRGRDGGQRRTARLEGNSTYRECSKEFPAKNQPSEILKSGQEMVEGIKEHVSWGYEAMNNSGKRSTLQVPRTFKPHQKVTKISQVPDVIQSADMATSQPGQSGQGVKTFKESRDKKKGSRIQGAGWSNSGPPSDRGGRGRGSRGRGTRGGRGEYRQEGNRPKQNMPHPSAYTPWNEGGKIQQADMGQANQGNGGYDQPAGFGRNGLGQPGDVRSYGFKYQDPAERINIKEEVKEKEIYEDGVKTLSTGPSGQSQIQFSRHFIEENESYRYFDRLVAEINWKRRVISKPDGREYNEPRKTHWFGEHPYYYCYTRVHFSQEWHPLVLELKEQIEVTTGYTYNSVLCNLYEDGRDGVQWHSDDELSLRENPVIASLSLGETRRFQLRKKVGPYAEDPEDYSQSEKYVMNLTSGSLLVMSGATQADWQHRVPKEYHDRGARINLTFRTIYPEEPRSRRTYPQYK